MVPSGWKPGRIGDLLISLDSGVSVNGIDRPLKDGESGVLKVSSVTYGQFNPRAVKAIRPDELSRAKTNPKAHQIIISRSNTKDLVGASAYIETDYKNLFLPDKLWITIPKPDANMKWLSYVLASRRIRYTLSNLATGTSGSMKNITKAELLSLRLVIPTPPEQQKIAEILSTWDKAIYKTEQLLENSRLQKKGLMQKLITHSPSDGLQRVRLADVCNIGRGRVISKKEIINNPGKYPVYSSQTLNKGIMGYLNSFDFEGEYVTWTTDGVNAGTVFYRTGRFNCTNVCGTLLVKVPDLDIRFLAYSLATETYKYVSHTLANPKLMNGIMATIKIPKPPLVEQKQIATILSTADREIEKLQQKLDLFKQEKKALMQQLLTGKRRVKVP